MVYLPVSIRHGAGLGYGGIHGVEGPGVEGQPGAGEGGAGRGGGAGRAGRAHAGHRPGPARPQLRRLGAAAAARTLLVAELLLAAPLGTPVGEPHLQTL